MYISKKYLWGNEGLKFGANFLEDDALFYPLIFSCNSILVIDEVFFIRRNREGSIMTMAPNAGHVSGAINCIETALKLYAKDGLSDEDRWHISKRIERHCVVYMQMAKAAEFKCSYEIIFNAAKKTKNLSIILKAIAYAAGLDNIGAIRRIWRVLRSVNFKIR